MDKPFKSLGGAEALWFLSRQYIKCCFICRVYSTYENTKQRQQESYRLVRFSTLVLNSVITATVDNRLITITRPYDMAVSQIVRV